MCETLTLIDAQHIYQQKTLAQSAVYKSGNIIAIAVRVCLIFGNVIPCINMICDFHMV